MNETLPPGALPFVPLSRHALPRFEARMVFDVGANIGQSSELFATAFPEAAIHAFEPVRRTFEAMQKRVAGLGQVAPHNLALGRRAGRRFVAPGPSSASHRLVGLSRFLFRDKLEQVRVTTGDRFCAGHSIARIDVLKIDTEGGDLAVLAGFRRMIAAQRIGLLEVEAGMNAANRRHVPLAVFQRFLEPRGYSLFHIYEQVLDSGFSGRPVLRRCNAVFISAVLADANNSKRRPG